MLAVRLGSMKAIQRGIVMLKEKQPKKYENTTTQMTANGSRLCEGKGLKALNFKLSTND
jgi:hypothetical protein